MVSAPRACFRLFRPAVPAVLAAVMLVVLGGAALAADATRPNVILIVADDLGAMDLGCCGSTFHKTPHLDRLASEGVRFAQSYAACPVCSPTRAALMTGKWPARLHLTDWLPGRPDMPAQKLNRPVIRQQLPLEEVTIAEALKSAGYRTASIGKWHLGGAGFEPTKQGFDLNIAGDQTGSPMSYFAPFKRAAKPGTTAPDAFMPGLEQAPEGQYLTDRLTDEAIKFIEAPHEQPFFLYLPHYAVHIPMRAKEALIAKYPPADTFRGKQNNPIYAAMLESVDEGIGRILKTLADRKLDEHTIVVFTSDNGGLAVTEGPNTPATSNAPLREGKGYLYEGGIRVPLIVKAPGLRTNVVSQTPTCSTDLVPTLLELCGVPPPDSKPSPDGVSLVPELKGAGTITRDALYWHYPHYANQGGRPGGAIREGDWKLIEFYENGRRELFQVGKDVGESQNVADKEPERVEQLAKKLATWRESVGAQMPTANPDYRPNPPDAKGRIVLNGRTAEVHGSMLRYEPLPHKATLGYWVRLDDWASFEFTVTEPGEFEVEALIGCGNGSGGSEVAFECDGQTLTHKVQETGGFQNFVPRQLGRLKFDKPGRHTLTIKPRTKPGVAVMDLREMTLTPVK